MATKMTKTEADYVDAADYAGAEPCHTCSMFLMNRHGCTAVKGYIDPNSHCRLYEPRGK